MLPQGKAYQALYKRLKHIEVIYKLDAAGNFAHTSSQQVYVIKYNNLYLLISNLNQ